MKFENDYFKIEITKKTLTKEQKLEKRKKNRKLIPVFALLILLLGGEIWFYVNRNNKNDDKKLTAENTESTSTEEKKDDAVEVADNTEAEIVDEDTEYINSVDLVAAAKENHKDDEQYGEPIDGLKRGDTISLPIGYDVEKLGIEDGTQLYRLFRDPELKYVVNANYSWNKEKKAIELAPGTYPVNSISTRDLDTGVVNMYSHTSNGFFDLGNGNDWGNMKNMYLVCYCDEQTGEKLEKPIVRLVTLEGELKEEPVLSYTISEDGLLGLNWTPVEGAQGYMICEMEEEEKGYTHPMVPIAYTEECSWQSELPEFDVLQVMNEKLCYFDKSEDDWLSDMMTGEVLEKYKQEYPKEYEEKSVVRDKNFIGRKALCVIAMAKEGTSMTSNAIDYELLSSNLPHALALNTEAKNGFKYKYKSINEIPIYDYVEMCDGRVLNKLIDYKTEEAKVLSEYYYTMDEKEENVTGREEVQCLNIPYVVEGTPFSGVMVVEEYDEKALSEDIAMIEEREANLRMRAGGVTPKANTDLQVDEQEVGKKLGIRREDKVYGNSGLSEYIAANMMAGKTSIMLTSFPETRDVNVLTDALFEAYYQNPLILGFSRYMTTRDGKFLVVQYEYTKEEQDQMQNAIRAKVKEITSEIIKEGMTEEEKEIAINAYLISHLEYNYEALEAAEQNNFVNVPKEFNNSFNAYGALVENKCVCQGYAEAFKALADEVGLECVVVSGMLQGEYPHAWNKVKIKDQWCVIDSTNNDAEYAENALFNVPDSIGNRILVEDRDYLIDKYLPEHKSSDGELEYYHITNNYFDIAQVADEIVKQFENGDCDKVMIRTDYDMTDEDFQLVCSQLAGRIGSDRKLSGCHWLGVICIFKE